MLRRLHFSFLRTEHAAETLCAIKNYEMKILNQYSLLILLAVAFTSCMRNKKNHNDVSFVKDDSIKIFAQDRPGGEPLEFNMAIDQGLDKLEITDPSIIDIDANELVLGMSTENIQIAIPIKYLSGFEVANLILESENYLLTWCPLVGSARVFESEIKGNKSGFDFGRGLKENNLLIIDRKTKTVWNQLSCKAIEGELEGERLSPLFSIQSTWNFWKGKYPNTKVAINRDTSNAAFPQNVLQKYYYNKWIPGDDFPNNSDHQIQNLGLGIDVNNSAIFFSLERLFENNSPLVYRQNDKELVIYFDALGLTAWAEDAKGGTIPSAIVYDWAWSNFYPNTIVFEK